MATYALLGLMGLTLIFALLAIAGFLSSHTGGSPKMKYWSKIHGGLAYITLSCAGLSSLMFLEGSRLVPGVLSFLFGIMGILILRSGLRLRKEMLNK